MTAVTISTYTYSVTYIADNILKSLKDIIRESGLNPTQFANAWRSNKSALETWLQGQYLEYVKLEIFNPTTDELIIAWQIDIEYGWGSGDGNFYTDTDQLKYHIRKAGIPPDTARYRLLLKHKPGAPPVDGWGDATSRSMAGFVRQSLGSTINHNGLAANTSYWRKAG